MLPIRFAALLAASSLFACASDLSEDSARDDSLDNPTTKPDTSGLPGPGGAQSLFSKADAGHYLAEIDASGGEWVYLDLEAQKQVFPTDPATSDAWDLAHKGVDIKLNGGVSGTPPNGVAVVIYGDKSDRNYDFGSLIAAPPSHAVEYHSDEQGSGLVQGNPAYPLSKPAYAFSNWPQPDTQPSQLDGSGDYGWYNYSGHLNGSQITARSNVAYILRSVECHYWGLHLLDYVNANGDTAQLRYEIKALTGGACSEDSNGVDLGKFVVSTTADGQLGKIDASDEEHWVYVDLLNGLQVQPTDPANDSSWDLAFKRSDIKMNGGASGQEDVALHDELHGDWSISNVPSDADFHQDSADGLAFINYPPEVTESSDACGGINGDFGWYYYSGFCNDGDGIHHISPRDVVYSLRARDGQHFKLRMLGYYSDAGQSAQVSFEFAVIAP